MDKQQLDVQSRLRNDDKKALEEVYVTYKEAFVNYGLRFNLDREDLIDVYQDSVIAMYQNFVTKKTQLDNSSLKTYLFSIGKHKIYDRLKERIQFVGAVVVEDDYEEVNLGESTLTKEQQLLRQYFSRLGESCQQILKLFYYRSLSIKEIVQKTHYKDENTVKSHKSRCLKKLIALIKQD
ncbi:RNA polymerase sigma-70 factor (ECF subfamily) [Kordia periserrulae]|uniref:RNA polymerase sigma-70 factor (ECF subfamily) n=1 Tax=Kordia periserrulae TaxID=701523 RepID=A0A2T6C1T4_9FLAO|nr:sigma-70 family RNA polymerase sigma factor [Kordia periserrulae]PTX62207.1 RNA polymerase sigma-70 factor (ECF subfamily) [Kordia periserrulae]